MLFISLRSVRFRKFLRPLLVALAFVSISASARPLLLPVSSTPYDRQLERVQPILTSISYQPLGFVSLNVVNRWTQWLHGVRYRYTAEWKTLAEVHADRSADCKAKALALYQVMQALGASNVRLVIGKYWLGSAATHAWLEWKTFDGTYILDPTFQRAATRETQNGYSYIPLYAYEGDQKFQAFDTTLFTQN
jgi:predicted transglutaminase-like cysteine proteinase